MTLRCPSVLQLSFHLAYDRHVQTTRFVCVTLCILTYRVHQKKFLTKRKQLSNSNENMHVHATCTYVDNISRGIVSTELGELVKRHR